MTPAEFKSARKRLGLTQSQMAEALGFEGRNGERTVRRYEEAGPSGSAARLAEMYLRHGIPPDLDPRRPR